MKRKTLLKILIPTGLVVVLTIGTFSYLGTYYKSKDVREYLTSDSNVKVENKKGMYVFDNLSNNDDAFIFYPGAKVDEKAYVPILREIADQGVDVYLIKMPFHFAIFDINAADKVYNNTSYANYYLGGHSLGGAMAAQYASETKNDINGLIFFASFSSKDLSKKDNIKALSLYGTNDGVLKFSSVEKGREYFNKDKYQEVAIEGGNHAQFGTYGKQSGDKNATISFEQQKKIVVQSVVDFIKG